MDTFSVQVLKAGGYANLKPAPHTLARWVPGTWPQEIKYRMTVYQLDAFQRIL